MPDPASLPKPPVIVAAEEPSEEEPAAADPPAPDAPSEVDETEGSRFPEWALIPAWKAPAGFPAGRSVYFIPVIVEKMAKRVGGAPIKLKDGSTQVCRQLVLWELNLGDEKAAITRGWEAFARPDFCRQLKRDPDALIADGVAALIRRYPAA